MQFTRETSASHLIHAVEGTRVRIGELWLEGNLIITAEEIVRDWSVTTPGRITVADLAPALRYEPELIVVGAGHGTQTPDVDLMADLAALGIGLEYMQTPAACRTYNVLVHEGRRVAAAIILEAADPADRPDPRSV